MSASRLAKLGFFLSLMLSLLAVVPLQAQRGPAMGRRGMSAERAQLEMRVRARMAEMMRERLYCAVVCDALDSIGLTHQSPTSPRSSSNSLGSVGNSLANSGA